jgi:hypothetical protein
MKKWTAILLLGFFSCDQTKVQEKSPTSTETLSEKSTPVKLGNNPSNLINGGLIAADSDRIYYVSTDSTDGLFSMKHDGSEITRLSSDYVEYLNVLNGWLYYRKARSDNNPNGGGLYKMTTGGKEEQRLTSDEPFYINVVDDWIYYVNWSSTTDVCKVKIDGTAQQILFSGHYQCLTTNGQQLFFSSMTDAGSSLLFSGTLDGKELKQILPDALDHPFVYDDWIYFTTNYGSKLCRVNTTNSKKEVLLQDPNLDADKFIYFNGSLYLSGVFGISKFDLSSKKKEKLFDTRVLSFGIASNYAYITTAFWDEQDERHTNTFLTKLSNIKK